MSGAFVFNQQNLGTPYTTTYQSITPINSPYIPPAHLYPSSPYHPSSPLPGPSTPNTPRRVHFEDEFGDTYGQRPRRPSFHGGTAASPIVSVNTTPVGSQPFLAVPVRSHTRRHSDGAPPPPVFVSPWNAWSPYPFVNISPFPVQPSQPITIHPLLNGEHPVPDFLFDLAAPSFMPMQVLPNSQFRPLTADECSEPATYPPVFRMRIVCDAIPDWPIEMLPNDPPPSSTLFAPASPWGGVAATPSPPPINLGDILVALHKTLQYQITQDEWSKLSVSEEAAVARAYTRRCKSAGSRDAVEAEASMGVRRVDFLHDKHYFRGLIRAGTVSGWGTNGGWEELKLIVGKKA